MQSTLALGAERARMIALTFGALMAVSLAALLDLVRAQGSAVHFICHDVFACRRCTWPIISGQGFDWPWLSYAVPLDSFAWNVPVGLSGAVACLFTREIADLKHFSPRVYEIFGWLAVAFVIITAANVAKFMGLLTVVNIIGNHHVHRRADVHRDRLLAGVAARQSRRGLVLDRLGSARGLHDCRRAAIPDGFLSRL